MRPCAGTLHCLTLLLALQLGHHPVKLFDAIALEAAPRACALTPQELSGLLWALAKCRHGGPGLPPLLHVSPRGGEAWGGRHRVASAMAVT